MRGIDTNILLRWLLDDSIVRDESSQQADLVSDLILNSKFPFFVNHIVIAETVWVLVKKIGKRRELVAEIIDRLLCSHNVVVDRREAVEAALKTFKTSKGDFADHLIGEVNRELGCETTITFDKAAAKSALFSQLVR